MLTATDCSKWSDRRRNTQNASTHEQTHSHNCMNAHTHTHLKPTKWIVSGEVNCLSLSSIADQSHSRSSRSLDHVQLGQYNISLICEYAWRLDSTHHQFSLQGLSQSSLLGLLLLLLQTGLTKDPLTCCTCNRRCCVCVCVCVQPDQVQGRQTQIHMSTKETAHGQGIVHLHLAWLSPPRPNPVGC